MKKQRKSVNRKAQQKQRKQKKPAMSDGTHDRRGFLKYLRTGAITAVVLGGVGVIGTRMVNATMARTRPDENRQWHPCCRANS